MYFSDLTNTVRISLYEEGKRSFNAEVSVLAKQPPAPNQRFGICVDDVNNFVNDLLALEIDGRKFRTKYLISWDSVAPLADNFAWTILANREKKEMLTDVTYIKPTAQHWLNFAREVSENETFKFWVDKAFTQAVWQFVATVPKMDLTGSTTEAKCNSVLTMVYINATRMLFKHLLENESEGIFSTAFMAALANCQTDEQMSNLVKRDFNKFLAPPSDNEKRLPEFNQAEPVIRQVIEYLRSKNMTYQRTTITEVFAKVISKKVIKVQNYFCIGYF